MSDEYSKPAKIKGNISPFFHREQIAMIGSTVNYNAKVLELALYKIELLEKAVFGQVSEEGQNGEDPRTTPEPIESD